MNTMNSAILAFVHAAEAEDINASFDKIERELALENELERVRAEHEKTRAALAAQIKVAQQIVSERQIEVALQNRPNVIPEARPMVTKLLLLGEAGELELDSKGRLREKTGLRGLDEVLNDYLKENPNFLGSGNAQSAPAAHKLDRAKMSTKEKAAYISAHGQEKYLALPLTKVTKLLLFVILAMLSSRRLCAQFTNGPQPGLPDRSAVHTASDAIDLFDARSTLIATSFSTEGTAGSALDGTQPATNVPGGSWSLVSGPMVSNPTFVTGGGVTWNDNTGADLLINTGQTNGTITFSNVGGPTYGYNLAVLSDSTGANCVLLTYNNASTVTITTVLAGIGTSTIGTGTVAPSNTATWNVTISGQTVTVNFNGTLITATLPTGTPLTSNTYAGINATFGGPATLRGFSVIAPNRPCTGALGTSGTCIPLTGGSESVAFSSSPTFSSSTRVSVMTLAGNVSSFTLAAGVDGQEKTLILCQNGTGGYTVAPPSNVRGFLPSLGTVANKCNGQHFIYVAPLSAWMSDDAEINQ